MKMVCQGQLFVVIIAMMCIEGSMGRFVDMTYVVNRALMKWPGHKSYNTTVAINGPFMGASFVASNNFETSEHTGTHMDSPYHFAPKGWKLHNIPLENLKGPAVVIDIVDKAMAYPDAMMNIDDVLAWEKEHKQEIPEKAVIVLNSGWNRYWGNATAYVGGDSVDSLHYPGFDPEAVKWLLTNRNVVGFVSDTVSCDIGTSWDFKSHVYMLEANKWCVEMGANVDRLPKKGSTLYAMPLKLEDGTGSPIRMFAMWDEEDPWHSTAAITLANVFIMLPLVIYSFLL